MLRSMMLTVPSLIFPTVSDCSISRTLAVNPAHPVAKIALACGKSVKYMSNIRARGFFHKLTQGPFFHNTGNKGHTDKKLACVLLYSEHIWENVMKSFKISTLSREWKGGRGAVDF